MTAQFVNQWIQLIRPIFPPEASMQVHEAGDIVLRIDWKLGNDLERPNKPSRIIKIVISEQAIEDCHDFSKAGEKFRKIIENKFRGFNPEHNHSQFVSPPVEEWLISTFDINS